MLSISDSLTSMPSIMIFFAWSKVSDRDCHMVFHGKLACFSQVIKYAYGVIKVPNILIREHPSVFINDILGSNSLVKAFKSIEGAKETLI